VRAAQLHRRQTRVASYHPTVSDYRIRRYRRTSWSAQQSTSAPNFRTLVGLSYRLAPPKSRSVGVTQALAKPPRVRPAYQLVLPRTRHRDVGSATSNFSIVLGQNTFSEIPMTRFHRAARSLLVQVRDPGAGAALGVTLAFHLLEVGLQRFARCGVSAAVAVSGDGLGVRVRGEVAQGQLGAQFLGLVSGQVRVGRAAALTTRGMTDDARSAQVFGIRR
jgi:hypothetical protein